VKLVNTLSFDLPSKVTFILNMYAPKLSPLNKNIYDV
jgi:hypothetical protein